MQLWDENRGSYPISQEKLGCRKRRFSKYIVTVNYMHNNNNEAHLFYQTIVLYVRNFSDVCDLNSITLEKRSFSTKSSRKKKCVLVVTVCTTSTSVASGHTTVLIQTTNLSVKSIKRASYKFLSRVHIAVGRCLLLDRLNTQRYPNVLENILWGS